MPNGTYGGVRGWGREAPAYSIYLWPKIVATDMIKKGNSAKYEEEK